MCFKFHRKIRNIDDYKILTLALKMSLSNSESNMTDKISIFLVKHHRNIRNYYILVFIHFEIWKLKLTIGGIFIAPQKSIKTFLSACMFNEEFCAILSISQLIIILLFLNIF